MAKSNSPETQESHYSELTWLGRDRGLSRLVGRSILRFIHLETAAGVMMLVATVIALVVANSPLGDSYHDLLEKHLRFELIGVLTIEESLEKWINDALMVIFFFVVGLEIKRELVVGDLRRPAVAALPAVAAVGGMIVPALLYTAFNAGTDGASGWGIPMATDIAFALGVVSLLGNRVPSSLKVFLLTLAIVDDIGAILVIAVFYTQDLSVTWMLVAVGIVGVLVMMRVARIWYTPAYVAVGFVLWLAVFESGVHATIAGVILGIFTPARPLVHEGKLSDQALQEISAEEIQPTSIRRAYFEVREQVSVADRLEVLLHPWVGFVIIPIFALANAGVPLSSESLSAAATSRVTYGIVLGLVLGKMVGVSLFAWLGVRSGLCSLPRAVGWLKMVGISAVAGIGFTVALFIESLAFDDHSSVALDEAKIGILAASAMASIIGIGILAFSKPVENPV